MRTIGLAELDDEIARVEREAAGSDDALRSLFAELILAQPADVVPEHVDPTASPYRDAQMALYERIAGKRYSIENESTDFDGSELRRWGFPYVTQSADTVGAYLVAYGQIIRTMGLEPAQRILEIGPGYGPLTYHLAAMGYELTCVDVSQRLLDHVAERTAGLPGPVRTVNSDMLDVPLDETFDGVLFFESFHHCRDHVAMLERLSGLVAPGGKVILAGEPIVPADSPIVPYPWGLRLDGLSLWSIRKFGWLELGFREDYFRELLARSGWEHRYIPHPEIAAAHIWLLTVP